MSEDKVVKKNPADVVAAVLFGIGLAMGILPIAVASLIVKHNLFTECFSRMDAFWRSRGWQ
jgi:hypothetical protein